MTNACIDWIVEPSWKIAGEEAASTYVELLLTSHAKKSSYN